MDALEICNKLRSEASGVATSGIPLDVFPQKMQQMILDLARTENYSIEFTVTSLISAMAAAVGNSCYIRINPHCSIQSRNSLISNIWIF